MITDAAADLVKVEVKEIPTLDLKETLPHMQYRGVFRYHRGAYKQTHPMFLLMVFWCMGCMTLFDCFDISISETATEFTFSAAGLFSKDSIPLWTMVVLVVMYVIMNDLQHRYSLQWLYILSLATVIAQASLILADYLKLLKMSNEEQEKRDSSYNIAFTAIGFIGVSSVYITCVAVARHLFPRELPGSCDRKVLYPTLRVLPHPHLLWLLVICQAGSRSASSCRRSSTRYKKSSWSKARSCFAPASSV